MVDLARKPIPFLSDVEAREPSFEHNGVRKAANEVAIFCEATATIILNHTLHMDISILVDVT